MKTFIIAAAALGAVGLPSAANAAQIMLTSNMIIGSLGSPYTWPGPITDQQTGSVTTAGQAWKGGYGALVTIDLGQAYDFGRFDFFTTDDIQFTLTGANHVSYNGFGSYLVDGATQVLATGDLTADPGNASGALSAQMFGDLTGSRTFRYLQLQIYDTSASREYILSELRIFDGAEPAVPEPASWALMITGFTLVGAAMRSRRPMAVDFS